MNTCTSSSSIWYIFFWISALSAIWFNRINASFGGDIFCGRTGHVLRFATKTLVDTTKAKCAFHCLNDIECPSFTFQPSIQTCVLHTYNNTSLPASIANGNSVWYSSYNCIVRSKLTGISFVLIHCSWLESRWGKIPISSDNYLSSEHHSRQKSRCLITTH